jgi:hypothetical protein
MSKQTNTLSRRTFLKGAAYTSALSVTGVSSLALAESANPKQYIVSGSSSHTVTLFNQSAKTVALNASQPVSLEKVNGWVVVKINKAAEQSTTDITLAAGQSQSFAVDTELAPMLIETGGDIVITNEYSALDNMIPITNYNAMVA